jgi:uncharacterized repeat protein (TIGR01451 family)
MATFFNQATLSYGGGVVNSNTTEAELQSGLEITKRAITASYTPGGNIVYAITVTNMGGSVYNDLTVTDNLGAYQLPEGGNAVPLTYVQGSLLYYLNGALQPSPTVTAAGNLEISGIDLPANSTATFIYETQANEFAPIAEGAAIINTASTNGGVGIGIISDTATVNVVEEPRLTIAEAVCPLVVNDNDPLTYTIIIQNLGNTPVVATDGVIVSDVFNPALSNITVTLDGTVLVVGTGYTYNEATGEFATLDGVITVPAATYTQDPVTGTVTTTPGVAVLTVTGTV